MPIVKDFMCFLMIAKDPGRSGMEITRLMILAGITEQNISEINRIAKKKSYTDSTDIDFVFDTLKNYYTLNVTQKHSLKEMVNLIRKSDKSCKYVLFERTCLQSNHVYFRNI